MPNTKKYFLSLCLMSAFLHADDCCDIGQKASKITARHIEGKGIGYGSGYTTLEAFLAPSRCYNEWSPFVDVRGHVFNNGKVAANTGIGVRYVGSLAVGINGFYDYRKTKHFHYNQAGAGLELIGSFWSVNVNGYLPFGNKKSTFFDKTTSGSGLIVSPFFQGNQIILARSGGLSVTGKQEFAFKGLDANVLFSVFENDFFSLEAGAGPYYFKGAYKEYAAGGQGIITARISDYVSLSVSDSYDNLFHNRLQGEFAISIPLGKRSFGESCCSYDCNVPSFFDYQLSSGVRRKEIIVTDKHSKQLSSVTFTGDVTAIDPLTGLPYVIYFVNNTSSSDGTFESPFPTLAEAEAVAQANDLIYVYPGDGTSMGMDMGISLKERQQLLGSGTPFALVTTVGTFIIPAETATSPLITNPGSTVVALNNNNVVSGIHFATDSVTSISGVAIENTTILSNQMESSLNPINLVNFTGLATIENNKLSLFTQEGITLNANLGVATVLTATIKNNVIQGIEGTSFKGIDISQSNISPSASMWTAIIEGNTCSGFTQADIYLDSQGEGTLVALVTNNTTTGSSSSPFGIQLDADETGIASISIINNTSSNHTAAEIAIDSRGTASNITCTITGNHCNEVQSNGIIVFANNSSMASASISGNFLNCKAGATGATAININASDTSTIAPSVTQNIISSFNNGIQINANNSSTISLPMSENAIISENTLIATGESYDPMMDNGSSGIQLSANDTATLRASITNNFLEHHTGFNLQVNAGGSSVTCAIENNILSLGSAVGNAFGILTPVGASNVDISITGNNITTEPGNVGSQFGIVYVLIPPSVATGQLFATISHNTITDCGNAPPSIAGFTAGLAVVNENAHDLSADVESNVIINSGTSSFGGFLGARINAGIPPGNMCLKLHGNTSLNGFVIDNDGGTGSAPAFIIDASGNTGAIIPFMGSVYSTGTCP